VLTNTQYDIVLAVCDGDAALSARLIYQDGFLSEGGAVFLTRALSTAIWSIISYPHNNLAELDLFTKEDGNQIHQWNATPLNPVQKCIHHLIEMAIPQYSQKIAIESWDGQLTYTELDEMASRLAGYLVDRCGLAPEVIVPLCFEKSKWTPVTMLAVLKAGGAYTFIDPAHPADRRKYIIGSVNAKIVITTKKLRSLFPDYETIVVDADLIRRISGSYAPVKSSSVDVRPENAAVVAFTSGSTGSPKGFVHDHNSVASGIVSNGPLIHLNNESRVFQFTSYTFDISITEIYSTLYHGGCVCIPSDEDRLNRVAEAMNSLRVTWTFFTPSFARFIQGEDIPSLRTVTIGGEPPSMDDVNAWAPKSQLLNAYGPSELSMWFVQELKVGQLKTISVGRAPNTRSWVVDPSNHEQLVPVGAIGELLLESPGLARGYLGDKERSAKAFIPAPSWRKIKGPLDFYMMYKTGDLVRYLPDGTLIYMGRKDTQVKLRGQRVELGEVEFHLRRHLPDSAESVADVVKAPGLSTQPILVAFICHDDWKRGSPLTTGLENELKAKLHKSLPIYMVPDIFIPMSSIPHTVSMKTDRQQLKHQAAELTLNDLRIQGPGKPETPHADGPIAPSSLRNSQTPPSFLSVSSSTDRSLPIPSPFSLIQPAGIKASVLADAVSQCQVLERAIEDVYPCAPQQQGLWALSLARDGDYMGQYILDLAPLVDIAKLRAAWETVVEMHSILRTRFIYSNGQTFQVVVRDRIEWKTSSSLDAYLKDDRRIQIDFGKPLVRYAIVPNKKSESARGAAHSLVWTAHHALYDGESTTLFLNHVAAAYNSNPLDPKRVIPLSYFIAYLSKSDESSAVQFWSSHFAGLPHTGFPKLPHPNYKVDPSLSYKRYLRFVRKPQSRITTPAILKAAWVLTMCNAMGDQDVLFGSTVAGRNADLPLIESVAGPTFSTFPNRIIMQSTQSVLQFLNGVQIQSAEMIPFEHTGMQKIGTISSECKLACQFQNLLVIQVDDPSAPYTQVFSYKEESTSLRKFTSHALLWECTLKPGGVDVHACFDGAVISAAQVREIADDFETFVHLLALEEDNRTVGSLLKVDVPVTDELKSATGYDTPGQSPERKVDFDLTVAKTIRKVWAQVLSLEEESVNLEDEFFRSGGTSITAMALVANARTQGVSFTVADVFRNHKLRELASVANATVQAEEKFGPFSLIQSLELETQLRKEAAAQCAVDDSRIRNIYPCTSLQEGLMASSQKKLGAYVAQWVFIVPPKVGKEAFRALWEKVSQSYDILRTRIMRIETTGSFQVILDQEVSWQNIINLEEYLNHDREQPMGYGKPLCRYAMAKQGSRNEPQKMVWTVHHALYDSYTLRMIFAAINAFHSDAAFPITTPFDRFIKHLQTVDEVATKTYWQTQFSDRPPATFPALPSSTYKPLAKSTLQTNITFSPSPALNTTLPNVLRAAWGLLVGHYSNDDDVVFGVTLSGRNAPVQSIEKIVGSTLTTIPTRIQLPRGQSLQDWLAAIQRQATDMIPYEQTGLSKIKSYGKACQDACEFQNLIVIQSAPEIYSDEDGIIQLEENMGDIAYFNDYALMVSITLNSTGAEVVASYDDVVLDEKQIKRLVRHFEHLLNEICSSSLERPVESLRHINQSDMKELEHWNKDVPPAERICLHDLIKPSMAKYPHSPAVESWDGYLSYSKLDELSSRLASCLIERGVKPETVVPLCFEKSMWAVVALLGVLKSGGAFAFLDPKHPPARQKVVLGKVHASIILTTKKYHHLFDNTRYQLLVVDSELFSTVGDADSFPSTEAQPGSMAYIVFTSGSTGTPKGIIHTHTSVSSSIIAHAPVLGINRDSRVIQFSAYTFDVIITEILATLMHGGVVCVPLDEERLGGGVAECLHRHGVNWAWLTPSFARLLKGKGQEITTLKTLMLGGEPLSAHDIEEWSKRLVLLNCYGVTEAQGWVVGNYSNGSQSKSATGFGVGTKVWILDTDRRPVPIGATGEIVFQSPTLAVGYLDDPAKTNQAFIDAPVWLSGANKGDKLYRTGDMGRFNSDGTIQVLGRIDLQVKIHGQRMELSEVEYHIKRHLPALSDAAAEVLTPAGEGATPMLVAFISLPPGYDERANGIRNDDSSPSKVLLRQLQSQLLNSLPYFMVPKTFIPFNPFPINVNGKLDRLELRHYGTSLTLQELMDFSNGVSPDQLWSPLELGEEIARQINEKLVEIVAGSDTQFAEKLRGRDVVLAHTGLDSIRTISLASFVTKTFGVKISVGSYTANNVTVRDIARAVKDMQAQGDEGLEEEHRDLWSDYTALNVQLRKQPISKGHDRTENDIRTVLVTGATGFLGIQIVRDLLTRSHIQKVIALVRAQDERHARKRMLSSARVARWWSPKLASCLEVWVGDLSKTKLGLNQDQWARLEGSASDREQRVDAIIHNGAVVHWDSSYESLRAANVLSTTQLLFLTAQTPSILAFTFVSGGDMLSDDQDDKENAEELSTASGYSQTKFVSELLVKSFAQRQPFTNRAVSIVKPGWIVGTAAEGVSNTDDFLWRVVAGTVRCGGYNSNGRSMWMNIAGVDQVAAIVADKCLLIRPQDAPMTRLLDGLTVGEFWKIVLESLGMSLRPMRLLKWIDALRKGVEETGQNHPMFPVMHWLEALDGNLGDDEPMAFEPRLRKEEIVSAIKKSVEYLASIEYLAAEEGAMGEEGIPVFKRTGISTRSL